MDKSNGPLKFQCAECGTAVPSGSGRRIVISDMVTESGFVEGADLVYQGQRKTGDYHGEMNAELFERYIRERAPNLKELAVKEGKSGIVLVMDNAPYHSRLQPHLKKPKRVKQAIKDWLDMNGVPYMPKETNAQLWQKVDEFLKGKRNQYVVDAFLKDEFAIDVLRLPPYHCVLNPIERCWSYRKMFLAKNNKTNKISDVERIWNESRKEVKPQCIRNNFRRVTEIEEQMWRIDSQVDLLEDSDDDDDESDGTVDISVLGDLISDLCD